MSKNVISNSSLKKTFWQLSTFLFAFIVLLVSHITFNYLIKDTDKQSEQEKIRLEIGHLIVDTINKTESNFYRLAPSRVEQSINFIHKNIKRHIEDLDNYLTVLQQGGEIKRIIRLNIDSQEQMVSIINYQPKENNTAFSLVSIELKPSLSNIINKADNLVKHLKNSNKLRNATNIDQKQLEQQINRNIQFIRAIPPFFARIKENANRMVFQSTQRLEELETEIARQQRLYGQIEIGIVVFIFISIIAIMYVFARQFDRSTNQLKRAVLQAEIAEKSQRESHEFIQHISDAMGEGVYAVNETGKCTFLNKKAEELLGWSYEELKILNVHNTIHYQNADGSQLLEKDCPTNKSILKGEIYSSDDDLFTRKDGKTFPIAIVSEPLLINQKITGSVAVFRDIAQRKQTEENLREAKQQAELANHMKSEFLSNMSHELRTPLNAIIGLSHVLSDSMETPDQRDNIDKIISASDTLLELINNILDLSKIESGKLDLEQIDFSLHDLIDKLSYLTAVKAKEKSLKIYYTVDPDVPDALYGDPLRINQILINLISNAIKFTDKGRIIVTISIKNNQELIFRVKDSGIGLSPEQQGKIFKAFSQADGSTTRKFGGTGLGLSISKQLSELMGGGIGVESKPGEGSTFFFTISCPKLEVKPTSVNNATTLFNKSVYLYVEDVIFRQFILAILNSFKIEHRVFTDKHDYIAKIDSTLNNKEKHESLPLLMASENFWSDSFDDNAQFLQFTSPLSGIIISNYGNNELIKNITTKNNNLCIQNFSNPLTSSHLVKVLQESTSEKRSKSNNNVQSNQEFKQYQCSVLVVEDNRVNQMVARKLLKRHGIEQIDIAENGQEGIELIKSGKHYDLVFMDIQMPVLDGIAATKEIRACIEYNELTIIALTAHAMQEQIQKFMAIGMNDHLAKPIIPENLSLILDKWLT